MNPLQAAEIICRTLLGHEPNEHELAWTEKLVRSVLPRGDDATPARTDPRFPPVTGSIRAVLATEDLLHERHAPYGHTCGSGANPDKVSTPGITRKSRRHG